MGFLVSRMHERVFGCPATVLLPLKNAPDARLVGKVGKLAVSFQEESICKWRTV